MKKILGVDTKNFIIYIIGLFLSIIFISVSFAFGSEDNWRNVFCGVGASGVGAVVLAYFIDFANIKSGENEIKNKRVILFASLKSNISSSISGMFILKTYSEYENIEMSYKNFAKCVDILINKYVLAVQNFCEYGRTSQNVQEALNLKQWEYSIRNIEENIKIILDNQIGLTSQHILSQIELSQLHESYKWILEARLPYFSIKHDKNINKIYLDFPSTSLSDTDIFNIRGCFKVYVESLDRLINVINELSDIKEMQYDNKG